jgi:hypothetical protein
LPGKVFETLAISMEAGEGIRQGRQTGGSASFLKKRSKKLLNGLRRVGSVPATGIAQRREKFFGSFFQKRTCFL